MTLDEVKKNWSKQPIIIRILFILLISYSLPLTEAIFLIEPVLLTLQTIFKLTEAPLAKLPIFQTPLEYEPTEAADER